MTWQIAMEPTLIIAVVAATAIVLLLTVALIFIMMQGYVKGALHIEPSQRLSTPRTIGFLHPFCNDGGGGERVLWVAIRELLRTFPKWNVLVYTGDAASDEEIRAHALARFGVTVPPSVVFVRLGVSVGFALPFASLSAR